MIGVLCSFVPDRDGLTMPSLSAGQVVFNLIQSFKQYSINVGFLTLDNIL